MCFCTCFFNLNVVVTGFLVNYRLGQRLVTLPNLSCNAVSFFSPFPKYKYYLTKTNYFIIKLTIMLMVWEASVTVIMGCGNCLRSIFFLVLKSKTKKNKSASALSASQWLTQAPGSMTGAPGSFTSSLASSSSPMFFSCGLETFTWYESHTKFMQSYEKFFCRGERMMNKKQSL